jgi:hypothetical protein
MQGRFAGIVENRGGSATSNDQPAPAMGWLSTAEWRSPDIPRRAVCSPPPTAVLNLTADQQPRPYSETRVTVPRNRRVKSTRPPGSGDPARNSPGHTYSGFALDCGGWAAMPAFERRQSYQVSACVLACFPPLRQVQKRRKDGAPMLRQGWGIHAGTTSGQRPIAAGRSLDPPAP